MAANVYKKPPRSDQTGGCAALGVLHRFASALAPPAISGSRRFHAPSPATSPQSRSEDSSAPALAPLSSSTVLPAPSHPTHAAAGAAGRAQTARKQAKSK